MSNINSQRSPLEQSMESKVHDAVGEVLDERFEDIQDAVVRRVLQRLQMSTYAGENGKYKQSKETEHKMFDPIAGP